MPIDPVAPPAELGSAEANRLFYEEHAAVYDETEFCAIDATPRELLRTQLARGLALVGENPAILDAGGGTGNASLLLHQMGHNTTLIDASPAMIARYEQKARAAGHEPATEVADLETFFASDDREWNLIVFSSVLHHLEDPAETLVAATDSLGAGGAIVTIFDPLAVDRAAMFLRKLDYACWIALHSPATLLRAIRRRLPGRSRGSTPQLNIPDLAERHAMSGLDDSLICRRVEAADLISVDHTRLHDARYRWIIALSRWLGQPTHFSFVFQRSRRT